MIPAFIRPRGAGQRPSLREVFPSGRPGLNSWLEGNVVVLGGSREGGRVHRPRHTYQANGKHACKTDSKTSIDGGVCMTPPGDGFVSMAIRFFASDAFCQGLFHYFPLHCDILSRITLEYPPRFLFRIGRIGTIGYVYFSGTPLHPGEFGCPRQVNASHTGWPRSLSRFMDSITKIRIWVESMYMTPIKTADFSRKLHGKNKKKIKKVRNSQHRILSLTIRLIENWEPLKKWAKTRISMIGDFIFLVVFLFVLWFCLYRTPGAKARNGKRFGDGAWSPSLDPGAYKTGATVRMLFRFLSPPFNKAGPCAKSITPS